MGRFRGIKIALAGYACFRIAAAPELAHGYAQAADQADLILRHGKIVTVDRGFSIRQALAVKDGRLIKVGTDDEVEAIRGPQTEVIDLGGKTVLPGLIDSHVHPTDACMTEFDHPIPELETIDDVLAYIKRAPRLWARAAGSSFGRCSSRGSRSNAIRVGPSSIAPRLITPSCLPRAPMPRSIRSRSN